MAATDRPILVRRLEAQRARHARRPRPIRVLYAIAGFTLLLAGLAMLVLPGPAFVVIPIALALLSLEFEWAERGLERALTEGEKARLRAARSSVLERVLTGAAVALAVAAYVAWAVMGDVPVLPG